MRLSPIRIQIKDAPHLPPGTDLYIGDRTPMLLYGLVNTLVSTRCGAVLQPELPGDADVYEFVMSGLNFHAEKGGNSRPDRAATVLTGDLGRYLNDTKRLRSFGYYSRIDPTSREFGRGDGNWRCSNSIGRRRGKGSGGKRTFAILPKRKHETRSRCGEGVCKQSHGNHGNGSGDRSYRGRSRWCNCWCGRRGNRGCWVRFLMESRHALFRYEL